MTIAVTKTEHNQAKIYQQAHASEWSLVIEAFQLDYVISSLQQIRDEILKSEMKEANVQAA